MSSADGTIVQLRGLIRQFPGVTALNGIDLDLQKGSIHGLVGENGAGKSTLMKLLAGLDRPDEGQIFLDGQAMNFRHPVDAQHRGIAMIHQELNLVEDLSAAENIWLGRERGILGFLPRRAAHSAATVLLRRLHCPIDPRKKVRTLSIAQRQMVEIAKALSTEARVLIMDEPTAVLTEPETRALMQVMRQLKSAGVAIVYISHRLAEVLAICDSVTVMRDGNVVARLSGEKLAATGERDLASLMVGREMKNHFPPRRPHDATVRLEVKGLVRRDQTAPVSFSIAQGEILGFAGLIGAGRTELAETLVGLRRPIAGGIFIDGCATHIGRFSDAIAAGMAYLSEDRKGLGLLLDLDISENLTLLSLKRFCRPLLSRRRQREAAISQARDVALPVRSTGDRVSTLSGGNQQKVALGKWLQIRPRILIVDEPTRGVDVGAKEQIYGLIQKLAAEGMAIMLISSELNEIRGLSHRIAVMRSGQIAGFLDGAAASEEQVMHLAAGV